MSRNKHKSHPEETLALLQNLQQNRKATLEIKSELLEHNGLLKLHGQDQHENENSGPEASEQNGRAKPAAFTLSQKNEKPGSSESQNEVFEKQNATNSRKADKEENSSIQASFPALPSLFEPWMKMQFQFSQLMLEGWCNLFSFNRQPGA